MAEIVRALAVRVSAADGPARAVVAPVVPVAGVPVVPAASRGLLAVLGLLVVFEEPRAVATARGLVVRVGPTATSVLASGTRTGSRTGEDSRDRGGMTRPSGIRSVVSSQVVGSATTGTATTAADALDVTIVADATNAVVERVAGT